MTTPRPEPLTVEELNIYRQLLASGPEHLDMIDVPRLLATIDQRDAQIAVLRDALKPFADFYARDKEKAEASPHLWPDKESLFNFGPHGLAFINVRHAYEALASIPAAHHIADAGKMVPKKPDREKMATKLAEIMQPHAPKYYMNHAYVIADALLADEELNLINGERDG